MQTRDTQQLKNALAALAAKYRGLIELRERREILEANLQFKPDAEERDARHAAMKRLAAQFPGALRELERYTARELRTDFARVQKAQQELRVGHIVEPGLARWAMTAHMRHRIWRDVLKLKRCLGSDTKRSAPARLDPLAIRTLYEEAGWNWSESIFVDHPDFLERICAPREISTSRLIEQLVTEQHGVEASRDDEQS